MKLLIIFGPPSVGKATVGQLIEQQTDFKLFHNHMVSDGVMHLFGVGTEAENRLSRTIRTHIIEEAAHAGINLIFTYVWNFAREKGKQNIDAYKQIYESQSGEVVFVELVAPLEVRKKRADTPKRQQTKVHAPNAERVTHLDTVLQTESPTPFFYPTVYKQINTTNKPAQQTAAEIITWLQR